MVEIIRDFYGLFEMTMTHSGLQDAYFSIDRDIGTGSSLFLMAHLFPQYLHRYQGFR